MPDSPFPNDASSFKPLSEREEAELVRRLKRGDEAALDRLLKAYWSGLLQFAVRMLGDRDRAQDVVQDAFIRLWNRRKEWERADTLRPVLYRIVRNGALNELRRATLFGRWADVFKRRSRILVPSPLQEVEDAELQEFLRQAIESLPERRREVFYLVRYHRLSYREVADVLGLAPQTVANHMTLAMKSLRDRLAPRLDEHDFPKDLLFRRPPAG